MAPQNGDKNKSKIRNKIFFRDFMNEFNEM